MSEERLRDRGLIVTGASGIAAAAARRFVAEGARLAVISRTAERCAGLVDELSAAGAEARAFVADLTEPRAGTEAVLAAIAWLGRVDGLYNVAGGSGRRLGDGPLHELTPEAYEATLRLNATTHVTASAPVLRAMLEQEPDAEGQRGSIVNTGSVLASRPVPALFATHAYASAKGAIAALTTTTAAYYAAHGIRVNMVAPALTVSRMSERARSDPATLDFAARKQPLTDGFIEAEDVAAAAAYLLSAEARGITGQTITVDGGWSVLPVGG